MDIKHLIMVLAGASEFDPQYNKYATSRPTDKMFYIHISSFINKVGVNLCCAYENPVSAITY